MSAEVTPGRLFLITGAQAAGKSTVGRALAEGMRKAVFIDGDSVDDVIVSDRMPMTEPPTVGAVEQLFLRYAGALTLADVYRSAGFDAVIADNVFGSFLDDYLILAAPEPLHLVMLNPSAEVIEQREDGRRKNAYRDGFTIDGLVATIEDGTARLGLWLDTSHLSVAQTVTQILQRADEALVDTVEVAAATDEQADR